MRISDHVYMVGSDQFALSYPLDCNCFLIDGGTALGLVDTGLGMGVDDIMANIISDGFDPELLKHILITHSHLGHWGGADALRQHTGAEVWVHTLGASLMESVDGDPAIELNFKYGRYPSEFKPRACPNVSTFADGERIQIGDIEVEAILVQGHTKDATCFSFSDNGKRALCTGDTVFYAGKLGLLNLDGFSMADYRRDIHKLANLEVDVLLPGHGVFVVRGGQKHIKRAIHKLSDFVMPETFFEVNEFTWESDYLEIMTDQESE